MEGWAKLQAAGSKPVIPVATGLPSGWASVPDYPTFSRIRLDLPPVLRLPALPLSESGADAVSGLSEEGGKRRMT